ncbi:MAG: lysophospholipid acyltransferase family protein [Candidatus Krumholzibacteria bacterium]|nr:lysophospholipid acyltransferase family protein [Candidatus Krumholzibacteria bacterium]
MSVRMTLMPVLGAGVIRALGASWRIRTGGEEHLAAARRHSPFLIFAFWHDRLLPLVHAYRGRRAAILASQHADGELLGRTLQRLGYGHVRGSSTRGGARAVMELVNVIRGGQDIGITVDGPRGPRHVVKPGAVQIARITGSAIIPFTSASRHHKTFASWDRFQLPYPGTRVMLRYGTPVVVPADAGDAMLEAKCLELGSILDRITQEADRDVGA